MKYPTKKMMVRLSPMAMDTLMYCVLTVQDEYEVGSVSYDCASVLENKLLSEARPQIDHFVLAVDQDEIYALFVVYVACLIVFYDAQLLSETDVEELLGSGMDVVRDIEQLMEMIQIIGKDA